MIVESTTDSWRSREEKREMKERTNKRTKEKKLPDYECQVLKYKQQTMVSFEACQSCVCVCMCVSVPLLARSVPDLFLCYIKIFPLVDG